MNLFAVLPAFRDGVIDVRGLTSHCVLFIYRYTNNVEFTCSLIPSSERRANYLTQKITGSSYRFYAEASWMAFVNGILKKIQKKSTFERFPDLIQKQLTDQI